MRPLGGWLVGSHRRRAGAVVGVRRRRRVLAAAGVAVDDSVHRRRARLRGAARTRERRRVQARARTISARYRHGDRPGRRAWRSRRILSAAAARRVSRSPRRVVAGLPAAVVDGAAVARGQPARVPSRRCLVAGVAAGGGAAIRRSRARRRMGGGHDAAARGRDRRRLAQPRALRCGARRLYLRDAVCVLRHHLSLRDVDRAAADADVLASRLAGVLCEARPLPKRREAR